ncbi:DUF6520 family protein [Mucilaginibacter sp.]|uniref:DUF6520 family protein n=1 Tax=Mucilaginibacter sp. TaxID=1882438 RepID=UPI00326588CF
MKNLKLSVSLAALVLGIGSAFATTANHSFTNKKWGRDPLTGVYTDVTGQSSPADYKCKDGANSCTEEYPADVDPNNQAGDTHPGTVTPVNIILGNFSQ